MNEQITDSRRRRIQRLKKIIILLLITSILLPTALCIFLFIQMKDMQKELEELREIVMLKQDEWLEASLRQENYVIEPELPEVEIITETVDNVETGSDRPEEKREVIEEYSRKVYLTFDDGPSCYTEDILDILKQYDVKATFFVVGKTDEASLRAYQRIVDEGHTLGTHSYSHKYFEIYKDVNAYGADMEKLQQLLYETTGIWSRYTRFPGGSSNSVSIGRIDEFVDYLNAQDIKYFDWNISSGDAESGYVSVQTIVDNVMRDIEKYNTAIVLMHDASDKRTTVEALPIIIERILEIPDTGILAIDDETVPVQHIEFTE